MSNISYDLYEKIYNIIEKNKINIDRFLYKHIDDAVDDLLLYNEKQLQDYIPEHLEIIKQLTKIVLSDDIRKHIHKCEKEKANLIKKIQWIDNPRIINENHNMIDNPPGMKVKLYDYQRAILYAMIDLENKRHIGNDYVNAGGLHSHTGSGKTIMILALCQFNQHADVKTYYLKDNNIVVQNINHNATNIIITTPNVFPQWQYEVNDKIEDISNYYFISCMADWHEYMRLKNKPNNLIVKYFRVKGQSIINIIGKSLESNDLGRYSAIGINVDKNCIFVNHRLIIDDFDIMKLQLADGELNASFYWYVSATHSKNTDERTEFNSYIYPRYTHNSQIMTKFSICATTDYINKCNQLPAINFYMTYSNNKYIMDIIKNIDEDILEMLSGDAIDEAAERLGIVATSIHDIFRRILTQNKFISQSECQICKFAINDDDISNIVIMACCGTLFCAECAIKGSKFVKTKNKIVGNCPSCLVNISVEQLIYLADKEILNYEIQNHEKPNNLNTDKRFDHLLSIIDGKLPTGAIKTELYFANLMTGSSDYNDFNQNRQLLIDNTNFIPMSNDTLSNNLKSNNPKILIFAKFKKTLEKICTFLDEQQIAYMILSGEKRQQIELFKNSSLRVMILQTDTDCNGLNLQFITDQVFFHRIKDKAVEGQCIGRCQRIGRIIPLRVHYLLL